MTAQQLLTRLRTLEIHVRVENGRLRLSAPKGRLTPELESELLARKAELVVLLEQRDRADCPRLVAVPRSSRLRLSYLQEQIWMQGRLQPGATTYNLAAIGSLPAPADVPRAVEALRRVVRRQEILRSRVVLDNGTPLVRIGVLEDVSIEVTDLRGATAEQLGGIVDNAAREAARRPFDLEAEPPVRFNLLQFSDTNAALLVAAHHIAVDSWSIGLLLREIVAEYELLLMHAPAAVTAPPLQYVDFAHWQRELTECDSAAGHLAYWRQRLAGLPQVTSFPTDRARSFYGSSESAVFDLRLAPDLYGRVRTMARSLGATTYMILLAALGVVLSRRTGQTDLAIGSPLGTRDRAELEPIVGPIVNPLVLRLNLADDPTFDELVARARDAVLEGHEHQDVPFEMVVKELNPDRSLAHSPLFQVALVLHNAPDAAKTRIYGGGAIYDLTLYAVERDGALDLALEYRTELYDAATIERIAHHVEGVLTAAVRDSGQPASVLGALPESERVLVVERFNDTRVDVDRATLVDRFRRTATARRHEIAVVASDRSLTYEALDLVSSALASHLRSAGAGPGTVVALATDRSAALLVSALAILKSGAAYLPIDLAYPATRIALMMRDSGAHIILTTRAMLSAVAAANLDATVVTVDEWWDAAGRPAVADGLAGPSPDDIAYLIYTSGSTGTPKGVLVPHSAVSNFLEGMRECVGFATSDVMLAVTTPSFDISVLELFLPLVQGGRVVVADRETVTDGNRLARLVKSSGATMLQSTPSVWRLLMNAGWEAHPGLCAIVGGEPLPAAVAEWLRPRVRALWNAYGPTETTVWSTMALIDDHQAITIGRPIANTRVYVLDGEGQPVPVGAPGELCIAGDGVARGYHRRPELTAERFVGDFLVPDARMYRTGDICRWRGDGRLEHLGRADGQVKVRGYRIETGEIEAALEDHALVKEAVVAVREVSADDPRIVAWVQVHDDEAVTGSELRRYLRERLPEHMIPAMILAVESFPLLPNGKVDRGALPEPFGAATATDSNGTPPSTPTEQVIADIWMRLLSVDRLTVTDSFFELGGHSLLAMRAANEIAERTGRVIDPRLLFFRTLGQLAEACDGLAGRSAGPYHA